ncbi:MAG TPA: agmatine deiminase family protein, partial [Acidobacteriota bacterium]|nr:agmatine deiminase family protein [Acidobacteriota bacterium]
MKRFAVLLLACLVFSSAGVFPVAAWDDPNSLPIYLTEEEKLRMDEIGINHRSTRQPTGEVRNPGEWEPSEGVIIRWTLGIPVEIVAEMSEDIVVTTIVANTSAQNSAISSYTSGGVNMANTAWVFAPTDSYWTRDYAPWFIFDDLNLAIVDHIYNRPRPNDDAVPQAIGTAWGMTVHAMDLIHTGGNHMSDGLGMSMSTRLVYDENPTKTEAQVDQLMLDYLGNDYTVLDYIEDGGIHHIDCWAKFLRPDTILVKDVDPGNESYERLNARADYLSQQTSSWGVPYNVVRIYCPTGTAYTNSIILNDKVIVPIFGSEWDDDALQVYQDTMPGYEILGFTGSWLDDDAIHCRTMGVPDRGMLFIDHMPFRSQDITGGDYLIQAKIVAHSGDPLIASSLKVHYSVNGGSWQSATMTSTGQPNMYSGCIPVQPVGSVIRYYIEAADESGRLEKHPYIGAPWAHEFTVIGSSLEYQSNSFTEACNGTG